MIRSMRMPLARARDPFWDLDGDGARRVRRKRVAVSVGILAAAVVLLLFVWGVPGVRAASTGVNLDQWASKDNAWQNGNLNGNNSRYPEGGIVPFRLAVEGVSAGATRSTSTTTSPPAATRRTTSSRPGTSTERQRQDLRGERAAAISSMCPSLPASTFAFPNDGYKANGLTVHGAEAYSAAPRRLTIYGGTITSISGPVHPARPTATARPTSS